GPNQQPSEVTGWLPTPDCETARGYIERGYYSDGHLQLAIRTPTLLQMRDKSVSTAPTMILGGQFQPLSRDFAGSVVFSSLGNRQGSFKLRRGRLPGYQSSICLNAIQ